ncbi:chromate resistance protein [Edaphobacter sp. 12200R-103]|nr:chromate resistance protein [Edaphobacter sp. 12200R-103]
MIIMHHRQPQVDIYLADRQHLRFGSSNKSSKRWRASSTGASNHCRQNRTWITRPRPCVDRVSSAWLIARFIDPKARFIFNNNPKERPGAVPFDMYQASGFSHTKIIAPSRPSADASESRTRSCFLLPKQFMMRTSKTSDSGAVKGSPSIPSSVVGAARGSRMRSFLSGG